MSVFLIIILLISFFPTDLFAWGLETHLKIGSTILENTSMTIIKNYSMNFLLGNIFPDFFTLLKNLSAIKRNFHTHSWDMLSKLFNNASEDSEKAFCYGYAAHLSADIIAHNYYIPQTFLFVSKNKYISHLLLEYAETRNSFLYEELLDELLEFSKENSDLFLKTTGISKEYFIKQIKYLKLTLKTQHFVRFKYFAYLFEKALDENFIERSNYYQKKAIEVAAKAVDNGFSEYCMYDPTGINSITKAKNLREKIRLNYGKNITKKLAKKKTFLKSFSADNFT
ncbi:MAG: zinc dependent phospholipase C family protein [Deferribacterota bacterium]|nr:zinc dependent phospholipase C family protein [Deferribacterota bacterium]